VVEHTSRSNNHICQEGAALLVGVVAGIHNAHAAGDDNTDRILAVEVGGSEELPIGKAMAHTLDAEGAVEDVEGAAEGVDAAAEPYEVVGEEAPSPVAAGPVAVAVVAAAVVVEAAEAAEPAEGVHIAVEFAAEPEVVLAQE